MKHDSFLQYLQNLQRKARTRELMYRETQVTLTNLITVNQSKKCEEGALQKTCMRLSRGNGLASETKIEPDHTLSKTKVIKLQ